MSTLLTFQANVLGDDFRPDADPALPFDAVDVGESEAEVSEAGAEPVSRSINAMSTKQNSPRSRNDPGKSIVVPPDSFTLGECFADEPLAISRQSWCWEELDSRKVSCVAGQGIADSLLVHQLGLSLARAESSWVSSGVAVSARPCT
jgi:hypothetical protein